MLMNLKEHNAKWFENEKQCPTFLTQISEIDKRWSEEDDQACLDLFHKIKTLGLLR